MSSMDDLRNLPDISFIEDTTLSDVLDEMKAAYEEKYEELTGDSLSLAESDPEMLKLGACALLIEQCLQYIDYTGKMNLLKYAEGDFLDQIAAGMHIFRKEGAAASTSIRFTLSATQEQPVTIPAGTRCVADDVYFETEQTAEVPAGSTYIDIPCICTELGEEGNDFEPGEISELVDPIYLVASVFNTTTSSGGEDAESDDDLAERYFLSFLSLAPWGGSPYYENLLKTWRGDIGDVVCQSPKPCYMDVYFLMQDASIPTEDVIAAAQSYLQDRTRRELCDVVTVKAPEQVGYNISLTYYIGESSRKNADAIQKAVTEAVETFKQWQSEKFGRDINPSMLFYQIMQAGAKRIDIQAPSFTSITETQIASCDAVNVTYGGMEDD